MILLLVKEPKRHKMMPNVMIIIKMAGSVDFRNNFVPGLGSE